MRNKEIPKQVRDDRETVFSDEADHIFQQWRVYAQIGIKLIVLRSNEEVVSQKCQGARKGWPVAGLCVKFESMQART